MHLRRLLMWPSEYTVALDRVSINMPDGVPYNNDGTHNIETTTTKK